jgi:hypothetical protein
VTLVEDRFLVGEIMIEGCLADAERLRRRRRFSRMCGEEVLGARASGIYRLRSEVEQPFKI